MEQQEHNFKLHPSLAMAACGATELLIIILLMDMYLKVALSVLVFLYSGHIIKTGLLQKENSITHLKRLNNGSWLLSTDKDTYQAELCGDSIVTRKILLLRFRKQNDLFSQSCLLLPDSLQCDEYRKLLIVLRND